MIREILAEFLTLEGFSVHTVEDGEKALTELRLRPYDLLITDLKMPRLSGLQLLEKIEAERLGVLTVLMTGFGTVETAIEAMKKGAYDYLLKPFKVEEVIHVVERALYRQRLQAENIRLREALTIYKVSEAIALSHDIEHILDVVLRAAIDEVKADVATLHLRDPRTGQLRGARQGRRGRRRAATALPSPAFGVLDRAVRAGRADPRARRQGVAVLHRGTRAPAELSSFVAVPLQVRGNMVGVLNVFSFTPGKKFDEGHRKMLAVLASRAASAIDNARLYGELRATQRQPDRARTCRSRRCSSRPSPGFAQALEESDLYTRGHSERVAVYSEILARGLTLPDAEIRRIVQAGVMHDVGKIGVRYDMLNKPGKLTPEEVAVFRQHPEKGKRILEPVPCLHGLIDGCWCHHEWFDGGGYPRGLARPQHPARRPHRRDRRRLRRDDLGPRVPPRAAARGRDRRDRALRRHAVRSRARRGVRAADRGLAHRHARARPGLADPAVASRRGHDATRSARSAGRRSPTPLRVSADLPELQASQIWANPIPVVGRARADRRRRAHRAARRSGARSRRGSASSRWSAASSRSTSRGSTAARARCARRPASIVDAGTLEPMWYASTRAEAESRAAVRGRAAARDVAALPPFTHDAEIERARRRSTALAASTTCSRSRPTSRRPAGTSRARHDGPHAFAPH